MWHQTIDYTQDMKYSLKILLMDVVKEFVSEQF